ncbi:MAG: DUF4440 domain-containing protein [Gemmatimonadota bacterium]|nr:DUF4440 domain-containing protein [Gemmatimonadota bacterium]
MTEAEIARLSRERTERIGRRAFDEMVDAFYAEDAQLLASGVATIHGRESIREFWRSTPDNGLVGLTLEPRQISVTGELAYEIGAFFRTLRPRHGAPFQQVGKYMVLYQPDADGSWKAIAEMFNTDSRR